MTFIDDLLLHRHKEAEIYIKQQENGLVHVSIKGSRPDIIHMVMIAMQNIVLNDTIRTAIRFIETKKEVLERNYLIKEVVEKIKMRSQPQERSIN